MPLFLLLILNVSLISSMLLDTQYSSSNFSSENDLFFLEKGVIVKNAAINSELNGMIASETYKMGSTLLQAGANAYDYKKGGDAAKKGIIT